MIKIEKIELERLEGLSEKATCKTFHGANEILLKWSATAPKTGGYDKCRFSVYWEDGEIYEGRYYLYHFPRRTDEGTEKPDLLLRIVKYCAMVLSDPFFYQDHETVQNFLDNYLPQRNYAKGAA